MNKNVLELKNIGNTSALWLQAIGIKTQQQLENMGSVEAYLRIQERGIKTSKVLLYTLEGALLDVHWNDIPNATKQRLCKEAENKNHIFNEA